MADTKITGLLSPQVTTNPATDVLPIVNIADTLMASSGSTRKITVNQLLGAGGTATLASATITGDLTVDTSTLKVVSASDVVGINTASPLTGNDAGLTIGAIGTVKALNIGLQNTFARLREKDAVDGFAITTNITGSNNQDDATKSSWKVRMGFANGNDNFIISRSGVGSTTFYDLYSQTTASAVWYDGAGGTRMTLNSTGLGVGATPSNYRLYVSAAFASGLNGAYIECGEFNKKSLVVNHTNVGVSANLFEVQKTGTALMTLDASGRLLVGSTSAFTDLTGSKEVKIGDGGIQTFSSAISAATPTNIARGGVGGLVYVGGFNGTGQYGAIVLWTAASATVVSVINGTGSTITFGVSAGFLQITSSLVLTQVSTSCIRI